MVISLVNKQCPFGHILLEVETYSGVVYHCGVCRALFDNDMKFIGFTRNSLDSQGNVMDILWWSPSMNRWNSCNEHA